MRGRFLTFSALVLVLGSGPAAAGRPQDGRLPSAEAGRVDATMVLALPDSPYRSLGQEIATLESIPLVDSLPEALARRPAYLLWVVSPTELSDRVASAFNVTLDRTPSRPSTGLITGSTLDRARELYERARRVKGDHSAAVVGETVFTTPQIVERAGERQDSRRLSSAGDVLELLNRADYIHYAGHGGSGYWRPLTHDSITAYELSRLPPVVISTMSCLTTRIWERGSIALRMVDEGAAAYSGFYYSPMLGFEIGEYDGSFRFTSPEVPIGDVIEAMNGGARKAYARHSFHLLLGDPRIALCSGPPCRLSDHGESGGVRTLSCSGAPSGLLPFRIRGGARFGFVEISRVTATWDRAPFFNSRLQMSTIGEDRVLLVEHGGGDLQITLRQQPPVIWRAVHPLADGLDNLLISMADRRHGGDVIALGLAAVAAAVVAWRLRRRTIGWLHMVPAATVGVIAAVLHASYAFARQGNIVVTNKAIVFSPLAAVGTGVLVGSGALFFFAARSWRGRALGTVIATSVGWVAGAIALGMTTVTNAAIASRTGIGVWIYRTQVYPFVLSALGCAVCAMAFSAARRIQTRTSSETRAMGNGAG